METSGLDGQHPSQVVVAYDRLVSFQVESVLFYGLLWSEVGVFKYDRPGSVSQQDGNTTGQVWR